MPITRSQSKKLQTSHQLTVSNNEYTKNHGPDNVTHKIPSSSVSSSFSTLAPEISGLLQTVIDNPNIKIQHFLHQIKLLFNNDIKNLFVKLISVYKKLKKAKSQLQFLKKLY